MKKLALAILILGTVLSLTQCELLVPTLQYRLTGTSSSVSINYQTKETPIAQVATTSPWTSEEIKLWSGDRPFVAFIEVVNHDTANGVTVDVLVNGEVEATTSIAASSGGVLYPTIN